MAMPEALRRLLTAAGPSGYERAPAPHQAVAVAV